MLPVQNVRESAPMHYVSNVEDERRAEEDAIIERAIGILGNRMRHEVEAFHSPDAVRNYLKLRLREMTHEIFGVLLLNKKHLLLEDRVLFRGTIDQSAAYPREVVREALAIGACAVIFYHNHPSGDSSPSSADETVTRKMKEALNLFEICVLDHFIIGDEVYSFAENGMI